MFTRYKGINIPENYSGNRFKAPIETETKTHKPTQNSVYGGTKTSISPIFENAIKERSYVNDMSETIQVPDDNYQNEEATYTQSTCEPQSIDFDEEFVENQDTKEPENEKSPKNSVLGDFASVFSQITSKIKQDDFIIIGVILLLLSEKGEDKDVILPLLLLLLYA